MPSSYTHPPPRSSRNHFVEPPSFSERFMNSLPDNLVPFIEHPLPRASPVSTTPKLRIQRHIRRAQQRLIPKRLLSLPNILILSWVLLLWWGERWVFRSSIANCLWSNWEKWVCASLLQMLSSPHNAQCNPCVCSRFLTTQFTAIGIERSPSHLYRRPSISRPAYLPRPPMALLHPHDASHGPLSHSLLLTDAEKIAP